MRRGEGRVAKLWDDLDRAKITKGARLYGETALSLDWIAGPEDMGRAGRVLDCRLD
jgi:hypothetical protein